MLNKVNLAKPTSPKLPANKNRKLNPNLVYKLFILGPTDFKQRVDLLERSGVEAGHHVLLPHVDQLGHGGTEL